MKRDVPSVYFGIIVGLSLGFVLCNVVQAETTGVWAYPLGRGEFVETGVACEDERVGDSYLTADHQLMFCYGEKGWNIVNFVEDIPCLATMEAAMRAMDEFVPPTDVFMMALNMIKTKDHDVGLASFIARSTLATKQWERAKACWRKP